MEPNALTLKSLSPQQWKSGIAAWLGWLFDGLDMHLYTVVAPVFVALLLGSSSSTSPDVKEKAAFIQAAFLVGWALGGAFFGRLGDLLGRSRSLSLTILTYALFTGLSSVAQTWWQLLIFRFIAALGIGGEWAVGSALLSETWPKNWRSWIAAVLQTGVNIGVLLATLATYLMAGHERWVFVVGILPALLVFWIRKNVPETDEWHAARAQSEKPPGVTALFRPPVLSVTLRTIAVCAASLTGWWAFQFWNLQYLRSLPEVQALDKTAVTQLASRAFAGIIGISILGNFFAGWLARRLGYRAAIALMLLGFALADIAAFIVPRPVAQLLWFLPAVGFFSGVFALFTMYLPPLFPVLLRTSGAGLCYNIGRIFAACGTVFFQLINPVGDMRLSLLALSGLFVLALLFALLLPDLRDAPGRESVGRRGT
jgi:MFS family permease